MRKSRYRFKGKDYKRKKFLFGAGCGILLLIVIIAISAGIKSCGSKPEDKTAKKNKTVSADTQNVEEKKGQEETDDKASAEPVQITVSTAGDCTLGTDEGFDQSTSLNAYYNEQGGAYFFQNVKSIFEADDLTIVNMEGTLTTSDSRAEKLYAFKGDPSYVDILTNGSVEAANMANNHSKDYGESSYEDTVKYLEEANITTFGYDKTAVMEIKGLKVGLVGIYVLADGMEREEQLKTNIAAVKEQGANLVIVSFHWGEERATVPNEIQKDLAHIAVDNGADLVVGHHPHVLQGIETYNGKKIVYSLGNFCFGGNKNPSDKDTMIFQQTFTFLDGKLQEDETVNIIPCSISSSSSRNNYQPTPAEGDEKTRIMEKIEMLSGKI
ncbi:CapA family protein [Lactonifactor longoviformis]|uniref:CapA family protein n=1 Tax=Lactonifactor longoviformis TaxID=341220 RepID=UPI0036F1D24A